MELKATNDIEAIQEALGYHVSEDLMLNESIYVSRWDDGSYSTNICAGRTPPIAADGSETHIYVHSNGDLDPDSEYLINHDDHERAAAWIDDEVGHVAMYLQLAKSHEIESGTETLLNIIPLDLPCHFQMDKSKGTIYLIEGGDRFTEIMGFSYDGNFVLSQRELRQVAEAGLLYDQNKNAELKGMLYECAEMAFASSDPPIDLSKPGIIQVLSDLLH